MCYVLTCDVLTCDVLTCDVLTCDVLVRRATPALSVSKGYLGNAYSSAIVGTIVVVRPRSVRGQAT